MLFITENIQIFNLINGPAIFAVSVAQATTISCRQKLPEHVEKNAWKSKSKSRQRLNNRLVLCSYVEFWIRIKLYRLREMRRHSQIMLNGWSLSQKLFAKTCIWYTTAPLNTIICTHNAIRGIPSAYEPYIHALVKMNEYTFVICMHEMWLCVHLEICMHEHWTPSQAQAQAQDSE